MSKSFGAQGPEIPHLSRGEVQDLRGDVGTAFSINEARTGFPVVDSCTPATVSKGAGANVDLTLSGTGFGTDVAAVAARLGLVALATQTGMIDTAAVVRIASADLTDLVIGKMNLEVDVDGVKCFPVTIDVTA